MKKLPIIYLLLSLAFLGACGKKETVAPVKPIETKPVETVDDPNYHKDGEFSLLYPALDNPVNIVVLGDGFIKEDLKKGGAYDLKVKETIDYLFTVAPFSLYKANFNVYVVYAESAKRGAAKGSNPDNKNSKFNAYFDSSITRLLIVGNKPLAYTYVEKAVPRNQTNLVIMLVNDETYGGSGGDIAVVSTHALSKYIMVHEIGHTFGGLGDEYVDLASAPFYSTSMVPLLPNVDTTTNRATIKWAHYFSRPAYLKTIGAFEGAYYRDKGFYRPEASSVMVDLNHTNYNAPSREAIARMIFKIRNQPFDLETFLKSDAASVTSVAPVITTDLKLPPHDFINMQQRLQELNKIRTQ